MAVQAGSTLQWFHEQRALKRGKQRRVDATWRAVGDRWLHEPVEIYLALST